ncbi:phospholipase D-like domain-containing protein [Luteimicrobium album]|nr:phospholipase D-like domain-containing protein [Luteimicrobium album]
MTLTAKSNATAKSKKVVLQAHATGTPWKTRSTRTIAAKTTSTTFRLVPPSAAVAYRVVVSTNVGSKTRKATSKTVVLQWKKPALSLTSAPKKFLAGKKITVTGTAVRTPATTKLRLQRKVGSRWTTVKTVTTKKANSPFTLAWTTPKTSSSLTLRVVTVKKSHAPAATSATWKTTKGNAVSISSSLSRTTFLKGQKTSIKGTATRVGKKAKVVLQEKHGSTWKNVTSNRTTSTARAYAFSVTEKAGNHTFRVVAPETKKTVQGVSAQRTLKHASCTAASTPSALSVFFTDSAHLNGSGVSTNLARVICATAPKATVSVSLYILRDQDSQAKRILDALRYVHAELGVKVRFILETTHGGTPVSVANAVRSFASVTTCDQGCTNTGKVGAHEHDKLLAISDMRWKSRTDPVVVLGSANWSNRQLNEYWQSATMFYDDATMYRDQVQKFDRMRTCGAGQCSSIKTVGSRSWVKSSAGNWGIAGDPVLTASGGSGASYQFFPSVTGTDDMVKDLRAITCRPGGTIRVGMYLTTPHRAKKIGTELGRLRKEGCDVKLLVGQGSSTPTPSSRSMPSPTTQVSHLSASASCTSSSRSSKVSRAAARAGRPSSSTAPRTGRRRGS